VRLIVARCEVRYTGRLTAVLPEALRLLMLKSDGSVMVHADTGGFKPQNWMTPPTVIEEEPGLIAIDNTLWSGKVLDPQEESDRAIAALNDRIAADGRVVAVQLTVRDGVTLIRRR